jgi:YD repeat-containing protein
VHLITLINLACKTQSEYDSHHRLLKRTYPEGNATAFAYDANHNIIKTTAWPKPCAGCSTAPLVVSQAQYNLTNNRLQWQQDGENHRTDYSYNGLGQLTQVQQPAATTGGLRPTTTLENYNSCGFPERTTDPAGVVTEADYDLSCNLISSTLIGDGGARFTTTYTPDAVGNVWQQADPETGAITEFLYDDNRNLTRTNMLASADNAHSIIEYDQEDRVTAQKVWDNERNRYVVNSQTYTLSAKFGVSVKTHASEQLLRTG